MLISEFNQKYFPIKVKFIEHKDEIKILSYDDYLKNKRSFVVLECNTKAD
jgi:hypothetical protein